MLSIFPSLKYNSEQYYFGLAEIGFKCFSKFNLLIGII